MIHEVGDGNQRSEIGNRPVMVVVIMGSHHVIDLLHTGLLEHGHDTVAVAIVRKMRTGIHHHGLAGRGHQQDCIPDIHVDKVDIQRICATRGADGENHQAESEEFHSIGTIISQDGGWPRNGATVIQIPYAG